MDVEEGNDRVMDIDADPGDCPSLYPFGALPQLPATPNTQPIYRNT